MEKDNLISKLTKNHEEITQLEIDIMKSLKKKDAQEASKIYENINNNKYIEITSDLRTISRKLYYQLNELNKVHKELHKLTSELMIYSSCYIRHFESIIKEERKEEKEEKRKIIVKFD